MPVVTQGAKQHIVPTRTLLTWKRFAQKHEYVEVTGIEPYLDSNINTLRVVAGKDADHTKCYRLNGKRVEVVNY